MITFIIMIPMVIIIVIIINSYSFIEQTKTTNRQIYPPNKM